MKTKIRLIAVCAIITVCICARGGEAPSDVNPNDSLAFVLVPKKDFRLLFCTELRVKVMERKRICVIDSCLARGPKDRREIVVGDGLKLKKVLEVAGMADWGRGRGDAFITIIGRKHIVRSSLGNRDDPAIRKFLNIEISPGDFVVKGCVY